MRIWKHITGQPFIFATGLAALVHSTWSLGTLFSGDEPTTWLAWVGWLIPALLIAFALDVGQIVTSAEIRSGSRTKAKYLTFLVFAGATYYLQWLYMAHHMPEVSLAAGVRESWAGAATLLRDAAVWLIPALMPLSTALYTFSYAPTPRNDDVSSAGMGRTDPQLAQVIRDPEPLPVALPAAPEQIGLMASSPDPDPANEIIQAEPVLYSYECPDCGFSNVYNSTSGREQGKRAHSRHCVARANVGAEHGISA